MSKINIQYVFLLLSIILSLGFVFIFANNSLISAADTELDNYCVYCGDGETCLESRCRELEECTVQQSTFDCVYSDSRYEPIRSTCSACPDPYCNEISCGNASTCQTRDGDCVPEEDIGIGYINNFCKPYCSPYNDFGCTEAKCVGPECVVKGALGYKQCSYTDAYEPIVGECKLGFNEFCYGDDCTREKCINGSHGYCELTGVRNNKCVLKAPEDRPTEMVICSAVCTGSEGRCTDPDSIQKCRDAVFCHIEFEGSYPVCKDGAEVVPPATKPCSDICLSSGCSGETYSECERIDGCEVKVEAGKNVCRDKVLIAPPPAEPDPGDGPVTPSPAGDVCSVLCTESSADVSCDVSEMIVCNNADDCKPEKRADGSHICVLSAIAAAPSGAPGGAGGASEDDTNKCGPHDEGIVTGLGCIEATPEGITSFLLRLFIGAGLGIAVIKGGLAIWKWRNAESPDKKQEAMSELMAVITGLVLLFLTVPILKLVGIDILGLNNYGGDELRTLLGS